MLTIRTESIFESPAEAWVNAVNCVGVMGKGIALEFKKRFPQMFLSYQSACAAGSVRIGTIHVHETGNLMGVKFILNFPSKRDWRDSSRLEDIQVGLRVLRAEIERLKITSVAVPALGCGLGGLSWDIVLPVIEDELAGLHDVQLLVYPPRIAK
jgi:O-acetyl-ADP-ribose deacetylase (regulator of RNase III)